MKTLDELKEELAEAMEQARRWSVHKARNVGNCPSDLQNYDAAWRWVQSLEFQIVERQAACKHRWEETAFGEKCWAPGTHQYTCHRCGKMNMITLGVDHEKTNRSSRADLRQSDSTR